MGDARTSYSQTEHNGHPFCFQSLLGEEAASYVFVSIMLLHSEVLTMGPLRGFALNSPSVSNFERFRHVVMSFLFSHEKMLIYNEISIRCKHKCSNKKKKTEDDSQNKPTTSHTHLKREADKVSDNQMDS